MSRGDRREDIFLEDVDRQDFLKSLAEICQKVGFEAHAYGWANTGLGKTAPVGERSLSGGWKGGGQANERDAHSEPSYGLIPLMALAPNHPAVWWMQASLRFFAGDQAGTLHAIQRGEEAPGASTRLSLSRAQWLENYGQFESSLAAYGRAIGGRVASPKLGAEEMRVAWLSCARLHARLGQVQAERIARSRAYGLHLSQRDAIAPSRLIDLTDFFTANLDDDWRAGGFRRHTLATLPRGRQVFAGVEYDVRGLIQLSSVMLERRGIWYPQAVDGILVQQSCRRIHFLHAADSDAAPGESLAVYTVRWVDGRDDAIPVRYDREVSSSDGVSMAENAPAAVAWRGTSPAGEPVVLFRTSWTNTRPDVVVATIDLTSSMKECAPFVVAITAE